MRKKAGSGYEAIHSPSTLLHLEVILHVCGCGYIPPPNPLNIRLNFKLDTRGDSRIHKHTYSVSRHDLQVMTYELCGVYKGAVSISIMGSHTILYLFSEVASVIIHFS